MNPIGEFLAKSETKDCNCEKHGAYISRAYPVGGKPIWSRCPLCVQEAKNERVVTEDAEHARQSQAKFEETMERAGIPRRFRDRTFDNFECVTPEMEAVRDQARDFVVNFKVHEARGTTAVFSGGPGAGKNHLAMAVAMGLMAKSKTVMALTVREAVMRMRASYRDGDAPSELEVLKVLTRVDLLILDEVGVQSGTDFEHDQIFTLIDMRYREGKPMLFLTNLSKKEFAAAIGARAFDRLQEAWLWVPFPWGSWRRKG